MSKFFKLGVILDMDIHKVINLYNSGLSLAKIAEGCGSSVSKVNWILKKNNVKLRSLSESHIVKKANYNFFERIDSEGKAYWLGFLYADASVTHNSLKLTLHPKDIGHLEKLKKSLESTHNIFFDRGYPRFAISNKKMYQDLVKNGCCERKTFLITFPDRKILPENLVRHFIRGYFDGDGSINYSKHSKYNYTLWKFEICSNHTFLKNFKSEFIKLSGVQTECELYKEKRRPTEIFYFKIGSQTCKNLSLIYHFLYNDSSIFLDRKKQKFEEITKLINDK